MKIRFNQQRRRTASILVVTVFIALFIGIILASYLLLIHSQNQSVSRSQTWNMSLAIAEAGVEEAMAHLNPGVGKTPPKNADGWNLSGGFYKRTDQQPVLNGYYGVVFSDFNYPSTVAPVFPIIYSTGYTKAPITGQVVSRVIEAQTGARMLFPVGVAARLGVDLNGNNIKIDSYDSSDTTNFPGGLYNAAHARDHGDVATSYITNGVTVSLGNADIKGRIRTGPGTVPTIGPNGSVGDSLWVDGGNNGIKPGWWVDDFNQDFPDVVEPYTSGTIPGSGTWAGTNYAYVLTTDNYKVNGDLTLNNGETLCVPSGQNAVLYVTGKFDGKNGSSIYLAPNANLSIYVAGASGNFYNVNTTGNANSFQYYGLPTNTSVTWGGNDEFMGTIYAPNAVLTLGGGGSDDKDYQGACVVKSANMNGHFSFHYDENLARAGPKSTLAVTSWREL